MCPPCLEKRLVELLALVPGTARSVHGRHAPPPAQWKKTRALAEIRQGFGKEGLLVLMLVCLVLNLLVRVRCLQRVPLQSAVDGGGSRHVREKNLLGGRVSCGVGGCGRDIGAGWWGGVGGGVLDQVDAIAESCSLCCGANEEGRRTLHIIDWTLTPTHDTQSQQAHS